MEALLGFLCDIIDGTHCTLQTVNDVAEKDQLLWGLAKAFQLERLKTSCKDK